MSTVNSCCANQERINVSAVPMAPQVSFQPLSSSLAYPGFKKGANSVNNKRHGIVNRISDT